MRSAATRSGMDCCHEHVRKAGHGTTVTGIHGIQVVPRNPESELRFAAVTIDRPERRTVSGPQVHRGEAFGNRLVWLRASDMRNHSLTGNSEEPCASVSVVGGGSLTATTGVTLGQAAVNPDGTWTPQPAYTLSHTGTTLTVPVPAASAVLITAR